MELFGHLERLFSETLYPYRWPLAGVTLLALALGAGFAWRAGRIAAAARLARRRPVLAGVSAALILAVILPTFWILASPLWTRTTLIEESPLAVAAAAATDAGTTAGSTPGASPPGTAATAATQEALPRLVLEGEWVGADEFHFARGRALIIEIAPGEYVLRVEDFSIRNGPDLFVYVSADPAGYTPQAVKLGGLLATDGAFNYEIPSGMSLEEIRSVVVWCDAFAVLFATARLM